MNKLAYACYLAKTAADMEVPLEDTPAAAPGSDEVADMVEAATNIAQQQVVADAVAKAQTEAAPNLIAAQEMLEEGAAPEGDVAPEVCEEEPQTAGEKMASLRYQTYLNKLAAMSDEDVQAQVDAIHRPFKGHWAGEATIGGLAGGGIGAGLGALLAGKAGAAILAPYAALAGASANISRGAGRRMDAARDVLQKAMLKGELNKNQKDVARQAMSVFSI